MMSVDQSAFQELSKQGRLAGNYGHEYAIGKGTKILTPAIKSIIMRSAPLAILMNEFYQKLQNETRTTPYPSTNEFERIGKI